MNYSFMEYDGKHRKILNPTQNEISKVIDELQAITPQEKGLSNFIILSSDDTFVQDCEIVQMYLDKDEEGVKTYCIEAHFIYEEGFQFFQNHIADKNTVKDIFKNFVLGMAPDVTGWKETGNDWVLTRMKNTLNDEHYSLIQQHFGVEKEKLLSISVPELRKLLFSSDKLLLMSELCDANEPRPEGRIACQIYTVFHPQHMEPIRDRAREYKKRQRDVVLKVKFVSDRASREYENLTDRKIYDVAWIYEDIADDGEVFKEYLLFSDDTPGRVIYDEIEMFDIASEINQNVIEQNAEKMEYELYIKSGGEIHSIIKPSTKDVETAINELIPEVDYFIVLTSSARNRSRTGCDYIQICMPYGTEAKGKYLIEASFDCSETPCGYRFFQIHIDDVDLAKGIFDMFLAGLGPSIDFWTNGTNGIVEEITDKIESEHKKCIYLKIKRNIAEDGKLPPDFKLEERADPTKLYFAPGMIDGAGLYGHFNLQRDESKAATLVELVKNHITTVKDSYVDEIKEILKETRFLSMANDFSSGLLKCMDDIGHDKLVKFANNIVMFSGNVEYVKLGISI